MAVVYSDLSEVIQKYTILNIDYLKYQKMFAECIQHKAGKTWV